MPKFALEIINELSGIIRVYALIRDGKNLFEESLKSIPDGYKPEISTLYAQIKYASARTQPLLPKKKFRKLNLGKSKCSGYEFKSKNLRLYCMTPPSNGYVICFIHTKKEQEATSIKQISNLIKDYTRS